MEAPELYIGIMSGTSMDGVDAVLVDLADGSPHLLGSVHEPFPAEIQDVLLALNRPGTDELHRAALAGNELADCYAAATRSLLEQTGKDAQAVRAIGCHGQTVRHRPDLGYTIQIGNAARLAELTGIAVASDFRSRDIAAGGQGAPLAPGFHEAAFASRQAGRVILNFGGISNVTVLVPGRSTIGFDCGPGNVLLDAWCRRHTGQPFDRDGAWSAAGRVLPELLARMLSHPFFDMSPPKSTGRDDFNPEWLGGLLEPGFDPQDVQATLAELSASAVAEAARRWFPEVRECYVCGGGARNADLLSRLRAGWPEARVEDTTALGLAPEWVEAAAFAWLARRTLHAQPGNLPSVTGARGPRVLGAISPR